MGTRATASYPMSGLFEALGFLTRLPVPAQRHSLSKNAVVWFPVAGAAVGVVVAASYALVGSVLPPFAAALIGVSVGILVTGAFHEDGLADSFDALGARGDAREAVRVMKDPRLGSFGVLAICTSLVARSAAIASMDGWDAATMIVCAHCLARAVPVGVMMMFPAAEHGLGSTLGGAMTSRLAYATLVTGLAIASLLAGLWGSVALALAAVVALILVRAIVRKAGGMNGDVLGAAEQAAEISILLLGSAIAVNGWLSPAWWR